MSPAPGFSLNQIGQIYIPVKDLDRALAFYRDTLGMRHLFTVPNMAFFDCGGVRLMLGVAEKPEFDHPASIIYYTVEDIQQAYQNLRDRGVHFEGQPHLIARMQGYDLWMAFLRDSESNMLALMCNVPQERATASK